MLTSQLTRSRTFRFSGNISRIAGRQAIGDREKSSEGKVKHIGARPFTQFFLLRGKKKVYLYQVAPWRPKAALHKWR